MNLPHPHAHLVGCMWLPRMIAKTRLYLAGELPFSYRLAFGSPQGVDGHFCRHFGIAMPAFIHAVRDSVTLGEVALWFLERRGVSEPRIAEWNALAPRLGAPGQPGRGAYLAARTVLYPNLWFRGAGTLFQAIILDEKLPPTVPGPEIHREQKFPPRR